MRARAADVVSPPLTHSGSRNTTARIVVSSEPKQFNHDVSQKEVFDTLDFLNGAMETRKKQTATPVEEVRCRPPRAARSWGDS